jgi:hypothetical protein
VADIPSSLADLNDLRLLAGALLPYRLPVHLEAAVEVGEAPHARDAVAVAREPADIIDRMGGIAGAVIGFGEVDRAPVPAPESTASNRSLLDPTVFGSMIEPLRLPSLSSSFARNGVVGPRPSG